MIDIAQKYSDELKLLFLNTAYDEKYMFYNGSWVSEYKPSTDNWNNYEFVSIDSDNKVIGYISYGIKRDTYSVDGLRIINFSDNKITFGKDVIKVIQDIFMKYSFRKLSFAVFVGNPIEKTYDKLIKKYGGRIIGIKEKDEKLLDGKLYDFKMYEIFRDEFIKNIKESR